MKKCLNTLILMLVLSGCGLAEESKNQHEKHNDRFEGAYYVKVITDTQTGCKYIYVDEANAGGLSPLYDSDGKLYCGK
ncbi:DUF6440 family protein [Cytobacillus horneckiae]|uniref:DUF6440 family protein n=1 Tax=Cytobacillus horneckiae TaxID=549687 RepID=UPI0034CD5CA7